ncbi:MAG: hypothetical protein OXG82_14670 [Gammaproteobacteria bacterium]|nr:hypothetical protein [Gammaproteobacteria bacterium]
MSRRDLFTGKAGEHAVISQFLVRHWQVAVPEVDVGDDLLIASDLSEVLRVQVKTSRAMEQKRCYVGRFNVPITQTTTPDTPELTYIFAVYRDQRWSDFIVVPRRHLHDEYSTYQGAAIGRKQWTLRIRFQGTSVICGGRDWTRFRDAWPATNRPP